MKPTQAHKASYIVRRLPDCYLVILGNQTYRITKHKFGSKTYYKTISSGIPKHLARCNYVCGHWR